MSTFKSWYAKPENREALNSKRREQYQTDIERRDKARAYQAEYRQRVAGPKPAFDGYTRAQVCEELGITQWVFNSWRSKNYFPQPVKVLGRVCITENQRNLIGLLSVFHASHGPKLSGQQKQELKGIVEVIHQNWS